MFVVFELFLVACDVVYDDLGAPLLFSRFLSSCCCFSGYHCF